MTGSRIRSLAGRMYRSIHLAWPQVPLGILLLFTGAINVSNGLQSQGFSLAYQILAHVIPLSELPIGAKAEVVALDDACQGFTRRRLLDLGMTPGASLLPEMRNFFGDPRAYRIRGTLIALRREQAEMVWVKPANGSGASG